MAVNEKNSTTGFTDNEIVKALEGAILNAKSVDCKVWSIEVNKLEDTLDLINRLQAEKEALIAGQETLQKYIANQKAEIEKLNQINFDLCNAGGRLLHKIEQIKAEAYKEFAEKVDDMLWQIKVDSLHRAENNKYCEIAHIRLQNLLKEKVGDINA